MKICTITGTEYAKSQKLINENEMEYVFIKQNLLWLIQSLMKEDYTDFYTNCEYGVPMWAAEIIVALKLYNQINLHIAVPFEEHNRNWPEEWRNRYYDVHQNADSIYVPNRDEPEDRDPYEVTWEHMAEESDLIVIAGTEEDGSFIADYAKKINVPIKLILFND